MKKLKRYIILAIVTLLLGVFLIGFLLLFFNYVDEYGFLKALYISLMGMLITLAHFWFLVLPIFILLVAVLFFFLIRSFWKKKTKI